MMGCILFSTAFQWRLKPNCLWLVQGCTARFVGRAVSCHSSPSQCRTEEDGMWQRLAELSFTAQ